MGAHARQARWRAPLRFLPGTETSVRLLHFMIVYRLVWRFGLPFQEIVLFLRILRFGEPSKSQIEVRKGRRSGCGTRIRGEAKKNVGRDGDAPPVPHLRFQMNEAFPWTDRRESKKTVGQRR